MVPTDSRVDFLARLLDVAALRHDVIAQNVANVNTPGYHRQEVQFEEFLSKALDGGKGLLEVKPQVITDPVATARNDGNTVDIEMEMAQLAKNSLLYKVYTQILATQLGHMRSAISGH
ncbi:MAG: flagellar biosynthesis protein FlgB [Planctomycetes bacterium]|nr:flagellar biosynthesis protein FlgB [Planctomycetota bacterium]